MGAIGGYFELADYEEGKGFPHPEGILLNTGRNALEYILRSIGDVKGIYLPYYTCEVVLEPLKKLHIPWVFYHINSDFEIADDIKPKKGEYIIANNYFGIKDSYIQKLAEKYGDYLIVDCAQALFAKPIPGIKSFYSIRKFVGVADGGVAYLGNEDDKGVEVDGVECTADHDKHLFTRKQFGAEAGFAEFQENEKKLDNQPVRWLSCTTRRILDNIDFDNVVEKRRVNFQYLHNSLSEKNFIALPPTDAFDCPIAYPLVLKGKREVRRELIYNKVFVAKYWPNVHQINTFQTEFDFATNLIPLPCDQRYGLEELNRVISIIQEL